VPSEASTHLKLLLEAFKEVIAHWSRVFPPLQGTIFKTAALACCPCAARLTSLSVALTPSKFQIQQVPYLQCRTTIQSSCIIPPPIIELALLMKSVRSSLPGEP
jgi:hypothetical protein